MFIFSDYCLLAVFDHSEPSAVTHFAIFFNYIMVSLSVFQVHFWVHEFVLTSLLDRVETLSLNMVR